jgi:hypothetical protein
MLHAEVHDAWCSELHVESRGARAVNGESLKVVQRDTPHSEWVLLARSSLSRRLSIDSNPEMISFRPRRMITPMLERR